MNQEQENEKPKKTKKVKKFTFKSDKPTGRFSSFYNTYHNIKYNGNVIGSITHDTFAIRLMVMKTETITDNNPNCDFKWITLNKKSSSLEEAKEFLNANIELILIKYTLRQSE
jgi:hypothetical protein